MENTVNQRIEQIIEKYAKGNTRQFAHSINVTPTSFANYVGKRKSKPGYDVLKSILETYPTLNPEWVIHGTGDMEKPKVLPAERAIEYKESYLEALEEIRELKGKMIDVFDKLTLAQEKLIVANEKLSGINYESLGKPKATNEKDSTPMPMEA